MDRGAFATGEGENRTLLRDPAGSAGERSAKSGSKDSGVGQRVSGARVSERVERALHGTAGQRCECASTDDRDAFPGEHTEPCGTAPGDKRLYGVMGGTAVADTESGSDAGAAPIHDPDRSAPGWNAANAHRGPFCNP